MSESSRLDADEAQRQRLESLGALEGGIAHDLNNLLMGILGNAELLAESLLPGSPQRARVEAITIAARRAAELTRTMRAWAGGGRSRSEPVDVSRLGDRISCEALPGATVLVVDDEAAVRDVTARILVRCGFEVITASHGDEGLEALRAADGRVAAIVLDLSMPRMGGDEMLRRLREIGHRIPVVLTSGYDERDRLRRASPDPFLVFLRKPFTPTALEQTLANLIARARAG